MSDVGAFEVIFPPNMGNLGCMLSAGFVYYLAWDSDGTADSGGVCVFWRLA